jgi:hypothetical protein
VTVILTLLYHVNDSIFFYPKELKDQNATLVDMLEICEKTELAMKETAKLHDLKASTSEIADHVVTSSSDTNRVLIQKLDLARDTAVTRRGDMTAGFDSVKTKITETLEAITVSLMAVFFSLCTE